MIRAVLDTNVLASGFVGFANPERVPVRLLRLWQDQRFVLVVSDEILTELINTFASPYFLQQRKRNICRGDARVARWPAGPQLFQL